jgi:hypothetical protein
MTTITHKGGGKKPPLLCSICQLPIPPEGPEENPWRGGHNAQPVNDGRCCEECNTQVVMPARANLIQMDEYIRRGIVKAPEAPASPPSSTRRDTDATS